MENKPMKFEARPDDGEGSGNEELVKKMEDIRKTWQLKGLDDATSVDETSMTQTENLIGNLRELNATIEFNGEIENLFKLRLFKFWESIDSVKNAISNNDAEFLQRELDHHLVDISRLKAVPDKFLEFYNLIMDLACHFYSITENYSRVTNALKAKGLSDEAERFKNKHTDISDRRAITLAELEEHKGELLDIIGKIEEKGKDIFDDNFNKEIFQKELDKTREAITNKLKI